MSVEEQTPGGGWRPACPEPLWFGWRLRKARCECRKEFRGRDAYREHWYAEHGAGAP